MIKIKCIIIIATFFISFNSHASCESDYQKMTTYLERSAYMNNAFTDNACKTADSLEIALNYAGSVRENCPSKKNIDSKIAIMVKGLKKAIMACLG